MALTIGGEAWLESIATRIEFRRAINELDRLSVELVPGDGSDLEDCVEACLPGTTWAYSVGLSEWTGDVVRAVIRSGEMPSRVSLVGLSALHRLRPARVTLSKEARLESVVSEIAKLAGVSVSTTQVMTDTEPIVLLDEPALAVLRRLADARDLVFTTDGTTLYFRPRSASSLFGDASVGWGEVADLQMTSDLSEVVGGVDAYGFDYENALGVSYKTMSTDLAGVSGGDTGPALRKSGFGSELRIAMDLGFSSAKSSEVKARAVGELTRRAASFVQVEVVVNQVRSGEPGGKLSLTDAPWPLAGPFRIGSVTHCYEAGGWTTRFGAWSDGLPAQALF